MEAGIGTGCLAFAIYKEYKAQIYGIDISKEMVDKCGQRSRKEKANFNLKVQDLARVKEEEKFFDAVVSCLTLHHLTDSEKLIFLKKIYKSLKPKGKIILFWPPEFGLSVYFFKLLVFISKNVLRIKNVKFHPDEVSRIPSRDWVYKVIERNHFKIIDYSFGIRDLFTYCVVVARKIT